MPKSNVPDTRPRWEREDENSNYPLRARDRAVIHAGARTVAIAGLAASAMIGVLPWGLVLLLRAAMGGSWHFDHWVWNMTIYAFGSLGMGVLMGWLRRWSAMGHRYHTVPMANTRGGWDTLLAVFLIDFFIMWIFIVDGVGLLLVFMMLGIVWAGLVYSMIWTPIHDRFVARLQKRAAPAPAPSRAMGG
jgi:hypothetical protein